MANPSNSLIVVPNTGVEAPATPDGQQQLISGTPWINGRGLIGGTNWRDNFQMTRDIFAGMGTWAGPAQFTASDASAPGQAASPVIAAYSWSDFTNATQTRSAIAAAPLVTSNISTLLPKIRDGLPVSMDLLDTFTWGASDGYSATDNTSAFLRAIAKCPSMVGRGKRQLLGIAGEVQVTAVGQQFRNIGFRQLMPSQIGPHGTILFNSDKLHVEGLYLDRGGNGSEGSLNGASGLYFAGGTHTINGLEVTGKGKGSGIVFAGCSSMAPAGIYVHDLYYDASANPVNDDAAQAIFVISCTDMAFLAPRTMRFTGIGGLSRYGETSVPFTTPTNIWTRSFAVAGCQNVVLIDPISDQADEHFDFTGSVGNKFCGVRGGRVTRARSYGGKLSGGGYGCFMDGLTVDGAGVAAIIITGPPAGAYTSPNPQYNEVRDCLLIDTGKDTAFKAGGGAPCGVKIDVQTGGPTNYPQNTTIVNTRAIDTQATKTMAYGFFDASSASAGGKNTLDANCKSFGHTIAPSSGFPTTAGTYS